MVLHLASSGSVVSVGPKDFQKIGATLIFRKNDRNETRTSGIARGRGGRSQVSISICLTDCLLYVKVFEIPVYEGVHTYRATGPFAAKRQGPAQKSF